MVPLAGLYSNHFDGLSTWLHLGELADRLLKLAEQARAHPYRPVPRLDRGHKLTESEVDDLVAAFQSGVTVKALAKHYSINRTTVMDHLRRRGVPRQGEWSEVAVKKAAARYEAGETLNEISLTMNVDPRTVGRQLRMAGVAIRPSGPKRRPTLD